MTSVALHQRPRWQDALREQLRIAGMLMRPLMLGVAATWLLFDAVVIYVSLQLSHPGSHGMQLGFAAEESVVAVAFTLLLALPMWLDEGPDRRLYHWMMPVDRTRHALMRTLGGWAWAMLLCGGFVANIVLITAISSALQHVPYPADPRVEPWHYLVPFAATTLAYVFASAATVGARRPFIWIAGIPLLHGLLVAGALYLRQASAFHALSAVATGKYGAFVAMGYGLSTAFGSPDAAGHHALFQWIGAFALWFAIGATLLVMVARMRQRART